MHVSPMRVDVWPIHTGTPIQMPKYGRIGVRMYGLQTRDAVTRMQRLGCFHRVQYHRATGMEKYDSKDTFRSSKDAKSSTQAIFQARH